MLGATSFDETASVSCERDTAICAKMAAVNHNLPICSLRSHCALARAKPLPTESLSQVCLPVTLPPA